MLGLAALIRSNAIERNFSTINPIGLAYDTLEFRTGATSSELSVVQARVADEIIPNALFLSHSGPLALDDVCFVVQIGQYDILSVPLSVLKTMGTCEEEDGETMIKFKFETFLESLPLIRINYHLVKYILRTSAANIAATGIESASIAVCYKYLETTERRALARQDRIMRPMQSIRRLPTEIDANTIKVVDFRSVPYCKGFIVEGNLEKLTEMNIYLSERAFQIHTRRNIRNIAERLCPNTFYIPFNASVPFAENTERSFLGSIDYSGWRQDNIHLKLTFTEPVGNMKVYAVVSDRFISQGSTVYTMTTVQYQSGVSESHTIPWADPISLPITNTDRNMCPISHELIEENQVYTTCSSCSHNYGHESLVQYFNTIRGGNYRCPMCRVGWCNYATYRNAPLNEMVALEAVG